MKEIIMHVEIDRDVAPPTKRQPKIHYPFDGMVVGDSFLLPCVDKRDVEKARSKVMHVSRYRGITIQTRTVPDGLRVWLVEGK